MASNNALEQILNQTLGKYPEEVTSFNLIILNNETLSLKLAQLHRMIRVSPTIKELQEVLTIGIIPVSRFIKGFNSPEIQISWEEIIKVFSKALHTVPLNNPEESKSFFLEIKNNFPESLGTEEKKRFISTILETELTIEISMKTRYISDNLYNLFSESADIFLARIDNLINKNASLDEKLKHTQAFLNFFKWTETICSGLGKNFDSKTNAANKIKIKAIEALQERIIQTISLIIEEYCSNKNTGSADLDSLRDIASNEFGPINKANKAVIAEFFSLEVADMITKKETYANILSFVEKYKVTVLPDSFYKMRISQVELHELRGIREHDVHNKRDIALMFQNLLRTEQLILEGIVSAKNHADFKILQDNVPSQLPYLHEKIMEQVRKLSTE